MSFIGDMFNSKKGAGFEAQGANNLIDTGVGPQIGQSTQQAQSGVAQQQNFLNALQAQNGIQNQSNVYNQLQGVANGTGPNPAQAQLAQATGQNTANQAALMASQRGSGSNAGLIARQAAMQGAANQQNAAGQAASMQAQQSLGALGQLSGLASQQVGQQAGALNSLNQAAQSEQQNLLNAAGQQNNVNAGMQSSINSANAGIAAGNQKAQAGLLGGVLGGVGSVLHLAQGGNVPSYADGGMPASTSGSFAGKFLNGFAQGSALGGGGTDESPLTTGMTSFGAGLGSRIKDLANKAKAPGPDDWFGTAGHHAKGGLIHNMKGGGKVPGEAKVRGDSLKNDTVPAMLSPKEIVIPRSITTGPDAPKNAAKFVAAILAKQGMKK